MEKHIFTRSDCIKGGRNSRKSERLVITQEVIAKTKGVTLSAVRKAIARKRLDPRSLESIIAYCTNDLRRSESL